MPDGDARPALDAKPPPGGVGRGFLRRLLVLRRAVVGGEARRAGALRDAGRAGAARAHAQRAPSSRCATSARTAPRRSRPDACVADPQGAQAVECPYHGWRFRTGDGACAAIPSLVDEQEMDVQRIRVRRYPVAREPGAGLGLDGADPRGDRRSPTTDPPVVRGRGRAARPSWSTAWTSTAHIDHAVVGLMDPAHGPYVHQQWWWRSGHSMHEKAKRVRAARIRASPWPRTRRRRTPAPTGSWAARR